MLIGSGRLDDSSKLSRVFWRSLLGQKRRRLAKEGPSLGHEVVGSSQRCLLAEQLLDLVVPFDHAGELARFLKRERNKIAEPLSIK